MEDMRPWSGERLRRRRQERGLTQAQLARLVGASEQVVSKWERDVQTPRPFHVAALARALQCDALDLFEPKSRMPRDPEPEPEPEGASC